MEHSSITWIQIPAKNLTRATLFYEKVFDASFFFEELNNIPHAIFKENLENIKLLNGALIKIEGEITSGVGPILFFNATGNFETMLSLIKEHGGEVIKTKELIKKRESDSSSSIPKTYIDNKPGYYAHFIDSEGNKMGLYGSN